jgi:hypothetical protein
MDDLSMFFTKEPQLETALKILNRIHELSKIWTNPTKLEYSAINSEDALPISTNGNMIFPANKKKTLGYSAAILTPIWF